MEFSKLWAKYLPVISLHHLISITLLLFVNILAIIGDSDVAMNPIALRSLAQLENEFLEKLYTIDEQIWEDQAFTSLLNKYKADVQDSFAGLRNYEGEGKVKAVVGNPVATYRLLRRMVNLLPDLREKMSPNHGELFSTFPNTTNLASHADIKDAIWAILRIQSVYVVDSTDFSEGVIVGIDTGAKLHGIHCYEMGIIAAGLDYHYLSIEWLEVALSKAEIDGTVETSLIKSTLESVIQKHDAAHGNAWKYDPNFYVQKLKPLQRFAKYKELRESRRTSLIQRIEADFEEDVDDIRFYEICRHGILETSKAELELSCWYDSEPNSYWTLAPLKVELLAEDPDIYQVYDVINDRQTKALQEIVKASLFRSRIDDSNNNGPGATRTFDGRTSVNDWVNERRRPATASIPKVIEKITGLSVAPASSAENLQVAAYTFGGHYNIHIDHLLAEDEIAARKGPRIATFMFYLESPERGGGTAFLRQGVAARPIKGSAVIWFNLYADGNPDFHTDHGACPVVLGEKWVANKWIRFYDQFLKRPCPLRVDERFKPILSTGYYNPDVSEDTEESEE